MYALGAVSREQANDPLVSDHVIQNPQSVIDAVAVENHGQVELRGVGARICRGLAEMLAQFGDAFDTGAHGVDLGKAGCQFHDYRPICERLARLAPIT
ncbi:hypothetical protein D2T32_05415 [Sinirhodobacter populi]|nr:hypothetical protein D2T32_05415 [Sinirhodobacter populi]